MSVVIVGIEDVRKVIQGMPLIPQHKLMQSINAEAAIPMIWAAHKAAPVGKTGNLAESIGSVKASIKRVDAIGLVNVGPRRTRGFKGFHSHLVEYPKTNRDGSMSTPKKFMQPAWDQTRNIVVNNIYNLLSGHLVRFMKRTLK